MLQLLQVDISLFINAVLKLYVHVYSSLYVNGDLVSTGEAALPARSFICETWHSLLRVASPARGGRWLME